MARRKHIYPAILAFKAVLMATFCSQVLAHGNLDILPPIKEWHGKSEQLIVSSNHPWQTPAEATGLTDSPDYADTVAYLKRLADSEPMFHLTSLGKSPQGRDIWLLVASADGEKTAVDLRANGKPTLFAQGGIHPGEVDGKDAGFMLLRDISKGGKKSLLDKVNLLFVPVLSVDGHERRAPDNRVNQRGPRHTGWRTNSHNLNLNRDYAKLDSVELRHLVRALNKWQPDLYFDIHVTNGEDYQYDITYGFNEFLVNSPNTLNWLQTAFRPALDSALARWGHLGGPLVFARDDKTFEKGINNYGFGPRYSHGYGDVRQLPTVLVENHSLKSFRQRVLGTYILLERTLELLASDGAALRTAVEHDRQLRPASQVLATEADTDNPDYMDFAGIEYQHYTDELTGVETIRWTGEPVTYKKLPVYQWRKAKTQVQVPKAFYIPVQYREVIERLEIHGVEMTELERPQVVRGKEFSVRNHQFAKSPFEGRFTVNAEFDIAAGQWGSARRHREN